MNCPNCNQHISLIYYRRRLRFKCPHCAAKLTLKNLSMALLLGTIIFGGVYSALVLAWVYPFVEVAIILSVWFIILFVLSKYLFRLDLGIVYVRSNRQASTYLGQDIKQIFVVLAAFLVGMFYFVLIQFAETERVRPHKEALIAEFQAILEHPLRRISIIPPPRSNVIQDV